MAKLPAFMFYPGDWLKDAELKICSIFARGLLVDLLCIMFEAKHRGRFVLSDGVTPWTDEQIVNAVAGSSTEEKLKGLQELLSNGVLKRCPENGYVYSARQLRDEEIRQERSKAGSKGGSKTQAKGQAKHQANDQAKTGFSVSVSPSGFESNRSRIESNRSVSPIGYSKFGLMLADKLAPKKSLDLQFVALVGRAIDERKITEALAQSALVGCDTAKNRIAMFRSSLAGNVKAAGGDLESILQSLTTGGDDANEAS